MKVYYCIIAYFDIVTLKMHWDKWSGFYDIDRRQVVMISTSFCFAY